ncbi:MAG: hypothetical protein Q9222_000230 [Ikaeria aurantiellina]
MDNNSDVPDFADLPLRPNDPPFSAWGLYGKHDELGTLNRLTDARVATAARDELQTGLRVNLNWALDAQKVPSFNRPPFHKEIIHKAPRTVNDDTWTLNTQSSTQWDGLRHFAYQKEKMFYNGVTLDDIHSKHHPSTVNGIQEAAWARRGIVGRGILLDFHSWRLANNVAYDPFETGSISLAQMKAVLDAQHTHVRFGDILFIRSGYIHGYNRLPQQAVEKFASVVPPHLSGVEQSEEILRWIWESFSAVAGDQPSFECWRKFRDAGRPTLLNVSFSNSKGMGSARGSALRLGHAHWRAF